MRVQPVIGADEEGYPCALYKPDNDGTHVVLPLDPAQIDDAAVEVMARTAYVSESLDSLPVEWETEDDFIRAMYRTVARAALAALLAHLAEVE